MTDDSTSAASPVADLAGQSALPSVSIVVPTHHRPEMLSRLLESLRRLAYPESRLELVVVGGEQDPGRRLVQSFAETVGFPARFVAVPSSALRSASLKRNEGASTARGEILAFTDDDCVVNPEWIAVGVVLFRNPVVGAVEGGVEIPKPERPTLTYRGSIRLSDAGGYQTCNMFYRKKVFEECGGFDPSFPYYLEDTDLAYTVMERGYSIPFAPGAIVAHPVQPGRPLKLFTMARSVERMPYLFAKHAESRKELRARVKPFNRSHYLYLATYAAGTIVITLDLRIGVLVLSVGLCTLLLLHLARDFWGLHFTLKELALTALFQPIVPVLRLFHWIRGFALVPQTGRDSKFGE